MNNTIIFYPYLYKLNRTIMEKAGEKMKSVIYKAKGEVDYSPDLIEIPKPKSG